MNIKSTDFVLEIGSGDNPHPRADILCDRFMTTNQERAGGFRIRVDRPFVVADGMRLPFPDRTFDYIITSHIFEHMDDPAGFAHEIMRVGNAGCIEVPSAISERVFGWNFHHWYCTLVRGALTLTPKNEGERWGEFYHRLIARAGWFRRWFEEHEDEWYVRIDWKEKIAVQVKMSPMSRDEMNGLDEKAWALLATAKPETLKDSVFAVRFFFRRVARKMRKTVRQIVWQAIKLTNVKMCVCPGCHGKLRIRRKSAECGQCHAEYPIDGTIPILLLPEERKNGY